MHHFCRRPKIFPLQCCCFDYNSTGRFTPSSFLRIILFVNGDSVIFIYFSFVDHQINFQEHVWGIGSKSFANILFVHSFWPSINPCSFIAEGNRLYDIGVKSVSFCNLHFTNEGVIPKHQPSTPLLSAGIRWRNVTHTTTTLEQEPRNTNTNFVVHTILETFRNVLFLCATFGKIILSANKSVVAFFRTELVRKLKT